MFFSLGNLLIIYINNVVPVRPNLAFGKLKQEESEFEVSMGYIHSKFHADELRKKI